MDIDRKVSIDWGAYGAPETFIVDAEGRIRYKQAARSPRMISTTRSSR